MFVLNTTLHVDGQINIHVTEVDGANQGLTWSAASKDLLFQLFFFINIQSHFTTFLACVESELSSFPILTFLNSGA